MRIGLTADGYGGFHIGKILKLFKTFGICFAETTIHAFKYPKIVSEIRRHMELGLHLPNIGNLGYDFSLSSYKGQIENDITLITQHRDKFNFVYAICHPPEKNNGKDSFNFYVDNLRQVGIPLMLENSLPCTYSRHQSVYKKLKTALGDSIEGVCLDIPHTLLSGEDWKENFLRWGPCVKVIHLSDCSPGQDKHLPFGSRNYLQLREIFDFLSQNRFQGILNFEIKPPTWGHVDLMLETYSEAAEYFELKDCQVAKWKNTIVKLACHILKSFHS
jgi:hypothetical protein